MAMLVCGVIAPGAQLLAASAAAPPARNYLTRR
jgi:hypothetical protein